MSENQEQENIVVPPKPPLPQTVHPYADKPLTSTTTVTKKKNKTPLYVASLALTGLLCAGLGGGVGASIAIASQDNQTTHSTIQEATGDTISNNTLTDYSDVVNNRVASVVTISVVTQQGSGTGSGVVIDNEGHIVTNSHVATLGGISKTGQITIQTSTGETASAELVGYDPTSDLAVLKTNLTNLKPIPFASSENLEVGDATIAIGAPLGLNSTVTTGIVSALNRPITVQSSEVIDPRTGDRNANGTVALNVIQTDAAINSGNSGGALLNSKGDLIGINVAIASTGGEQSGNIGVGFAIPSSLVKQVADDIINTGKVSRGFLGITVDDYSETPGSGFVTGATVKTVQAGSAADKAGLKENDVITKVNDVTVTSATQLVALVKQQNVNEPINLTVKQSDGVEKTVEAKLDVTGD